MSAWICPDEHINVIVSYFVKRVGYEGLWLELDDKFQYLDEYNAAKVAQILYAENVKSVNSRYNEDTSDEYMGWHYYQQARNKYSVAEIAQAINSYSYQSSETEGFYLSKAAQIIAAMQKELLREIIEKENVDIDTWRIEKVKE